MSPSPHWMGQLLVRSREGRKMAEKRKGHTHTHTHSLPTSILTAGEDYNATVRDIVFRAGVEEELVRVPVRDDSVREEGEMFSALISSSDSDVIFRQDSATVSIIDDDGKRYSKIIPVTHNMFACLR